MISFNAYNHCEWQEWPTPLNLWEDEFVQGHTDWRPRTEVFSLLAAPPPPTPSSPLWLWNALILPSPKEFHFYFLALPPLWKWVWKLTAHLVPRDIFLFILCSHHSSSKRPLISGFRIWIYWCPSWFCGFFTLSHFPEASTLKFALSSSHWLPNLWTVLWHFSRSMVFFLGAMTQACTPLRGFKQGCEKVLPSVSSHLHDNAVAFWYFWQNQNFGLRSSGNHL